MLIRNILEAAKKFVFGQAPSDRQNHSVLIAASEGRTDDAALTKQAFSSAAPSACFAVISGDNRPERVFSNHYLAGLADAPLTWACAGKNRSPSPHLPARVRFLDAGGVGLVRGRNRVLQTATEEIVVFLDDDVTLPEGWHSKILEPFDDPTVAIVGCRYLPDYEHAPPPWMDRLWAESDGFRYLWQLSLLDGGPQSRHCPSNFVFGLCFAARRQAMIDLGGFHPDAFPWDMIRMRGDGETGICAKADAAGLKAYYQAETHVLHKVPAQRMTTAYFQRRAFIEGITNSYTEIRKNGLAKPESSVDPVIDINRVCFNEVTPESLPEAMKQRTREGYQYHQTETARDPELLSWIRKETYFD